RRPRIGRGRAARRIGRSAGAARAAPRSLPRDEERGDDRPRGPLGPGDRPRRRPPGAPRAARRLPARGSLLAPARDRFALPAAGRTPVRGGEHLFDSCRPVGSLPFAPRTGRSPVRGLENGSLGRLKREMDREQALDTVLGQIERQFGKGAVMKMNEQAQTAIPAVSTGSLSLDVALGVGGLPRGRIVEVFGPESSGKTTLVYHVIAEAQRRGGICAFIDAEHAM